VRNTKIVAAMAAGSLLVTALDSRFRLALSDSAKISRYEF
jgi:hypothetical protein